MKNKLLAVLFFLVLTGFRSYANHFVGSEISYVKTGPATYSVTLKIFHLCPTAQLPTNNIHIRAVGCNPGRLVTLSYMGPQYGPLYGSWGTCSNPVNYGAMVYQGNLTFNGNEQMCSDWILSHKISPRNDVANLTNSASYDLYTETTLKLNSSLMNSSPQFDVINQFAPVVSPGQPALISMSATDPDGDSLSYELAQPLDDYNVPVPYAAVQSNGNLLPPSASAPIAGSPFANGACIVYNTNPAPNCPLFKSNIFDFLDPRPVQYAVLPSGYCVGGGTSLTTYSADYPLISFKPIDWSNCQTNVQAGPVFILNPQDGSLIFYPSYYNSSPTQHNNNRYAVSVKVKEWRKINGVLTLLGFIRRETIIIVEPNTGNLSPRLAGSTGNPTFIKEFVVPPGSTFNYSFYATDANAADTVTMLSNAVSKLPGATFTITNGKLPTGILNWTTTAAHTRNLPYYFNIFVRDNASSRGYTTETIKVSVRNSGVSSTEDEITSNLSLAAFPNPFTEEVSFKLNLKQGISGRLIIYNIMGREVDRIELKNMSAGEQTVSWENASKMASGSYLVRLVSGDIRHQSIKFVKLK